MSRYTGGFASPKNSAKSTYSINSDYKDVPLITSPSQKSGFLKKTHPFSVKALNKSHTMNVTSID